MLLKYGLSCRASSLDKSLFKSSKFKSVEQKRWIDFLINRYSKPLVRYATALLDNKELARQVVYDCLVSLLRQEVRPPREATQAWLYQECRRRCRNFPYKANKNTSRPKGQSRLFKESLIENHSAHIELKNLSASLIDLPFNVQEAIWLKYRDGLSDPELSRIMSLTAAELSSLFDAAFESFSRKMNPTDEAPLPASELKDHWKNLLLHVFSDRAQDGLTPEQLSHLQPKYSRSHHPWVPFVLAGVFIGACATVFFAIPIDRHTFKAMKPAEPPSLETPYKSASQPMESQPTISELTFVEKVPKELEKEFARPTETPSTPRHERPLPNQAQSKNAPPANEEGRRFTFLKNKTKAPSQLPKSRVNAFIEKALSNERKCIPSSLKAQELSITLQVTPSGQIGKVEVQGKSENSARGALGRCLKKRLSAKNEKFKNSANKPLQITAFLKIH